MRYFKLLLSGAVVLALSTVCSADVTNGGFETGDFTGWATSGNLVYPWDVQVTTDAPHSGTYAAHFGAYGDLGDATIMSNTFLTTPGDFYVVSFSYGEYNENPTHTPEFIATDPIAYGLANELKAYWDNGANPFFSDANFFTTDRALTQQHDSFYNSVAFLLQANSASTTISFSAFDQQQDVILDDVSVTRLDGRLDPVPEPSSIAVVAGLLACIGVVVRRKKQHA